MRTLLLLALLAAVMQAMHAAERGFVPIRRQASDHVALVIGNSSYRFAKLANPANDARAVAEALEATGFRVTRLIDAGRSEMLSAIAAFGSRIEQARAAVFYYAGHGAQVGGENWLLPIDDTPDASINDERQIPYRAVSLNEVLVHMERSRVAVNIVILDACRNNPFRRSSRAAVQGLAEVKAPVGTLILYATTPGSVAEDGNGQHSPFTQALLQHLHTPGLDVRLMITEINKTVFELTGGRQVPWASLSLREGFCFVPALTIDDLLAQKHEQLARLEADERQRHQQAAEAQKHRERLHAELAAHQQELRELDRRISELQQRTQGLRPPVQGRSGANDMEQMLALARQRWEQQVEMRRARREAQRAFIERAREGWRGILDRYRGEVAAIEEARGVLLRDLKLWREICAYDSSLTDDSWKQLRDKWQLMIPQPPAPHRWSSFVAQVLAYPPPARAATRAACPRGAEGARRGAPSALPPSCCLCRRRGEG